MALSDGLLQSLNTNEEILTQKLIHDVMEIFNTMVGLDDLLHLPTQIEPVTIFNDCVSSMVGLCGTYNGLVSLHMPSNLAIAATSSMLDIEIDKDSEKVSDAMGEIANMIAGSFKQHLSKSGLDVRLSIPSVVYGKEYVITLGNKLEQIALRFSAIEDLFTVSVAFE